MCNPRYFSAVLLFFTWTTNAVYGAPAAKDESAELKKLLSQIDQLWVGEASVAQLAMDVVTANYKRTLELKYWVKGKKNTIVLITAPKKEKGTATLKIGEDMYNYLPKVAKTIKVSAALRGGAWMGSHFTNDDLIRATLLGDHYDGKVLAKKKSAGAMIWKVELEPKKNAATPWGKVLLEFDKDKLLPISQQYFDEDKKLVRTIRYSQVKKLGQRTVPTVIKVTPEDKQGEYTQLTYKAIDYSIKLEDSFFSLTRLENL